jgi:glycerol-3-phosphate dehydrogenase
MNRNPVNLTKKDFDILVIGGGIYGACMVWEAASRGLSVALIERGDFCSATSANSLKIIHGGLRYLQHGDFKRMRESTAERKILMRIAPHLVHPLPVLVPTYGWGMKGKPILSLALAINDGVSCDRNIGLDPQKYLPNGRTISRSQCLELAPGLNPDGLTGAAIFYDAQVYNSERLPLAFIQSAVGAGASVANYVEATGLLCEGRQVRGVRARDRLSGNEFEIGARTTVATCGPWVDRLRQWLGGSAPAMPLAKAINLITRPLFSDYAVGLSSRPPSRDPRATLDRGSRLLFVAPWRGKSIVGTAYFPCDRPPDTLRATPGEIQQLLDDINRAYPPARLTLGDVSFVHCGLLPSTGIDPHNGEPAIAQHPYVSNMGYDGLYCAVGVKYTTARHVAVKTIDRVFRGWGEPPVPSTSAFTPLEGGQIDRFEAFVQGLRRPETVAEDTMRELVYNYGTAVPQLLHEAGTTPDSDRILDAQVCHAIRAEMAVQLSDTVVRRTGLGSLGHPGKAPLERCARVMGRELGWTEREIQAQLQQVEAIYNLNLNNLDDRSEQDDRETLAHSTV